MMTKIYGFLTILIGSLILMTAASSAQTKEPFQDVAHEILKDSIAMRTVKGYGQVPKLANYLKDRFIKAGFAEDDIMLIPHEETMALIARYRGDGSSQKKAMLLSSHMDVVEALPEDWQRDPYTLIEENGFFYGRGVNDTKLSVATLVATMLRLKSEGFVPSRDIILALSGDEETYMTTTKLMSTKYRDAIDAEFAIIADGGGGQLSEEGVATSFSVDGAEKTYVTFEVTARNPGGHSSLPRKDNAIYDMTRALGKLEAHSFSVLYSDLTLAYFAKAAPMVGGEVGAAMTAFSKNPKDLKAVKILRDYPEYGGITGTTCVTTMLGAGHAENALPQSAMATVNCRVFPGVSIEEIKAELQQVMDNDSFEWAIYDSTQESDASPMRADIFEAVERAVHAEYPNIPIIPHMALGASDGSYFRAAGIPSYALTGIFIKSSDEFSHGLNERVPQQSLPTSMRLWYSLLTELAG